MKNKNFYHINMGVANMKITFSGLNTVIGAMWMIFWIGGIVLAKGWVTVTAAILFPPFAWYLFIEKIMLLLGIM